MKLPSAEDPGWNNFSEHHQRFMETHPDFEQHIMEEFQYLAELREQYVDAESIAEKTKERSSTWEFVSDWYPIEKENFLITVDSPFGRLNFTGSWQAETSSSQTIRTLNLSWVGTTTNPHQWLVIFLSADTLLPLGEALLLGSAATGGSRQLPADVVTGSEQQLAFRFILSRAELRVDLPSKLSPASSALPEVQHKVRSTANASDRTFRRPSGRNSILFETKAAAGSTIIPKRIQELPQEFFQDEAVSLEFADTTAGLWQVRVRGTQRELILTFWSINGELMGEPLRAGAEYNELPTQKISEIARVDISVAY